MDFRLSTNYVNGKSLVEVVDERGLIATICATPDGSLKIVSKYATGEVKEGRLQSHYFPVIDSLVGQDEPSRTLAGERIRAFVVTLGDKPQKVKS